MELSPYLITTTSLEHPGQTILFAARTGALVVLPNDVFADLRQGRVAEDHRVHLIEMGFLVEDKEVERQAVYDYIDEINRINPNLTLAIVLGMECNFTCRYCFEGQQKGKHSMDDQTADQLVRFIKQRFGPKKERLHLQIYGGEPLLYTRRLIGLAEQLKPFAENLGAAFSFDLISNGSLLTEKVVDNLTPLGLDGVKVTLDGPPENHNLFRPFKSGQPSFETIVGNLAKVCSKTKIRLGGNYTLENYKTFPAILDDLCQKGITPDRLEVVNFNIVMQVGDKLAANEYLGGCRTVNEPWLREASLFIREEVFKRGYALGEITPSPCAVEVDDALTVNYDGSLYKCVTWIGHDDFKIGTIWQGFQKNAQANHYARHWQRAAKCQQCVYLPLCFGGCRFMEFQRSGSMAQVDCQKEYFDHTLPAMLQQEVKYRSG